MFSHLVNVLKILQKKTNYNQDKLTIHAKPVIFLNTYFNYFYRVLTQEKYRSAGSYENYLGSDVVHQLSSSGI